MDAWRPSTKKTYTTYLRQWGVFCIRKGVSVLKPSLQQVCSFLKELSLRGLGYGALNTARSALATFLPMYEGYPLGKHPLICWLIKGAYERNPPRARYTCFWDVNKIFALFKNWGRNKELNRKQLTLKLAVLLLLVTSQRGQTIVNLSIQDLDIADRAVFKMTSLLKHNRLGDPLDTIVVDPFDTCYRLCPVRTLRAYLERTEEVRKGQQQLLLSFCPPYGAITRDTLARWTLIVLGLAGVDTSKYRSHSTRGASVSAAKRLGASLNVILRHAGWRNAESFARFYNKDLEREPAQVGNLLLSQAH